MVKRAVCVGINDYPGTYNDLKGCVNDANDWAGLLREHFGFGNNIKILTDTEATRSNLLSALGDLVTSAKSGDVVVFTYSGHGTWVYDKGERDESDNRDEAICAFDGNIIDDEIRAVIRKVDRKAQLVVISDSCHSGTGTRAMLKRTYNIDKEAAKYAPKPRYMPPLDYVDAQRSAFVPVRKRFLYPEADMSELLLTGCNAMEYSYDAYISDRYNGAMTAMAIRCIKNNPKQTFLDFHKKLRQFLPSPHYPQHPQLEGADANKKSQLFTPM
jgi:hypothetical protein